MQMARVIRGARCVAVAFVFAAACAAQTASQAPVVPTDHYGPPTCLHVSAAHGDAADKAKAEQEQGAVLDRALLAAEPVENFEIQRYRLADYADCVGSGGCYWADLDAQYRRADIALAAASAGRRAGEKLAVVMDIDETTLSSYCEMKREDFGYLPALANVWVVSSEAAVAIPGALRLFQHAKSLGVAVYFLTGRPGAANANQTAPAHTADQTGATRQNLENAGFHGWDGLILRGADEIGVPTIQYKSQERQKIAALGYRLVMSVGDQWSDLLGTPQAEISVKLPNPFYFLP